MLRVHAVQSLEAELKKKKGHYWHLTVRNEVSKNNAWE